MTADPKPSRLKVLGQWIKEGTTSTDWFIVLLTAVIAGTSYLQWHEIRSGSVDTHTLAEAAKKQADKAETISSSVARAVTAMEISNAQAKESLSRTSDQNKAALDATIAAYQLERRAFISGNRPWLYITLADQRFAPNIKTFVVANVQNVGRTPAIKVTDVAAHALIKRANEAADFMKNLVIERPKFPTGIIAPGTDNPQQIALDEVPDLDRINHDIDVIVVYGRVEYADALGGTTPYYTEFCYAFDPHAVSIAWKSCLWHNQMR